MERFRFILCLLVFCFSIQAKTKNKVDWTTYTILEMATIKIPNSVEFRERGSFADSLANLIKNWDFRARGLSTPNYEYVFWPPRPTNTYARIMILLEESEFFEFMQKLSDTEIRNINNSEDMRLLSESWKKEAIDEMSALQMKMIKWNQIVYRKNKNNICYLHNSFIRQWADKPPVYVSKCTFYKNGVQMTITLSYRLSERQLWESDFNEVIDSFRFIK